MQDEVNPVTFLYPFMKEAMQDHIQSFLITFAL